MFSISFNEYFIFDSFYFSCSTFNPSANIVGFILKLYQNLTASHHFHSYLLVQAAVITFNSNPISLLDLHPFTFCSAQTEWSLKYKPHQSALLLQHSNDLLSHRELNLNSLNNVESSPGSDLRCRWVFIFGSGTTVLSPAHQKPAALAALLFQHHQVCFNLMDFDSAKPDA